MEAAAANQPAQVEDCLLGPAAVFLQARAADFLQVQAVVYLLAQVADFQLGPEVDCLPGLAADSQLDPAVDYLPAPVAGCLPAPVADFQLDLAGVCRQALANNLKPFTASGPVTSAGLLLSAPAPLISMPPPNDSSGALIRNFVKILGHSGAAA